MTTDDSDRQIPHLVKAIATLNPETKTVAGTTPIKAIARQNINRFYSLKLEPGFFYFQPDQKLCEWLARQ